MKKYTEPKLFIIALKSESILHESGVLGGDNLGDNNDFI